MAQSTKAHEMELKRLRKRGKHLFRLDLPINVVDTRKLKVYLREDNITIRKFFIDHVYEYLQEKEQQDSNDIYANFKLTDLY